MPAGQSEPRYSPSDDVTSIDRFSTRPCPLSTSKPLDLGLAPVLEGGKAGLWLAKAAAMSLASVGWFSFTGRT